MFFSQCRRLEYLSEWVGLWPKQFYGPLFSIKCHPRHISIGLPGAMAGPFVAISLAIMRVRLQKMAF